MNLPALQLGSLCSHLLELLPLLHPPPSDAVGAVDDSSQLIHVRQVMQQGSSRKRMELLLSRVEDEVLSNDPAPADREKTVPWCEEVLTNGVVLEAFRGRKLDQRGSDIDMGAWSAPGGPDAAKHLFPIQDQGDP